MRAVLGLALAVVAASPALAGAPLPRVPEMDAGAGIAVLALLIGSAAIIREKFFRK